MDRGGSENLSGHTLALLHIMCIYCVYTSTRLSALCVLVFSALFSMVLPGLFLKRFPQLSSAAPFIPHTLQSDVVVRGR